jgi:hypothetical protein
MVPVLLVNLSPVMLKAVVVAALVLAEMPTLEELGVQVVVMLSTMGEILIALKAPVSMVFMIARYLY